MGGFGGGMGGLGLFGGLLSTLLTIGLLVGLVFLGIWLWRRFGASEGVGFLDATSRDPAGVGPRDSADPVCSR